MPDNDSGDRNERPESQQGKADHSFDALRSNVSNSNEEKPDRGNSIEHVASELKKSSVEQAPSSDKDRASGVAEANIDKKGYLKDTGKDLWKMGEGALELGATIATAGASGAASAAGQGGKLAAGEATKQAGKQAGKQVGQEAAKTVAEEAAKKTAEETAKKSASALPSIDAPLSSAPAKPAGSTGAQSPIKDAAKDAAGNQVKEGLDPNKSQASTSDAPNKTAEQSKPEQSKAEKIQDSLGGDQAQRSSPRQQRKDQAKEKQSQEWEADHRGISERVTDQFQSKTGVDPKSALGKLPLGVGKLAESTANITQRGERFGVRALKRGASLIGMVLVAIFVFTMMGAISSAPDEEYLAYDDSGMGACLPDGSTIGDDAEDWDRYEAHQVGYIQEFIAAAKGYFPRSNGYSASDQRQAARIGLITVLVESQVNNYANSSVPESLDIEHDRVGSDHDSVGLVQQRPSMGWGDMPGSTWNGGDRVAVVQRLMDPQWSAYAFYRALNRYDGWETGTPGPYAQDVQGSAHPHRYQQRVSEADSMLDAFFADTDASTPPEPFSAATSGEGGDESADDEWVGCDGTPDGDVVAGLDGWVNPHPAGVITSGFRTPIRPTHKGLDVAEPGAMCGAPLYAAQEGTVVFSGMEPWGAWMLVIDHGDGLKTGYAHMQQRPNVNVGDRIEAGHNFGTEGTTGRSTGCHLHLEISVNGNFIDPVPFLSERDISW